jgi:hypothetical protein
LDAIDIGVTRFSMPMEIFIDEMIAEFTDLGTLKNDFVLEI